MAPDINDTKTLLRKLKKSNPRPGDTANSYVRNLIYKISKILTVNKELITEDELNRTIREFLNKKGELCYAYSGIYLRGSSFDFDHAIPINKDYLGFHIHGNILPCHAFFNSMKNKLSYDEFLEKLSTIGVQTKIKNAPAIVKKAEGIIIKPVGKNYLVRMNKKIAKERRARIKSFLYLSGYSKKTKRAKKNLNLKEEYNEILRMVEQFKVEFKRDYKRP